MNEIDISNVTYEEIIEYIDNKILGIIEAGYNASKNSITEGTVNYINELQLVKNYLEDICTDIKDKELEDE